MVFNTMQFPFFGLRRPQLRSTTGKPRLEFHHHSKPPRNVSVLRRRLECAGVCFFIFILCFLIFFEITLFIVIIFMVYNLFTSTICFCSLFLLCCILFVIYTWCLQAFGVLFLKFCLLFSMFFSLFIWSEHVSCFDMI